MANPFVGPTNVHTPTGVTDPQGDNYLFTATPYHVAGILLVALLILVALQISGFRAMVGIGR